MSDDEREAQAAKVAQLRQDVELYTLILQERIALLTEAEYELGRIDGRREH
jgi:hypothetical protein